MRMDMYKNATIIMVAMKVEKNATTNGKRTSSEEKKKKKPARCCNMHSAKLKPWNSTPYLQ